MAINQTLQLRGMDVATACADLEARTTAGIRNDFGRLIYLASTRDYNTGEYHHEGLSSKFGSEIAAPALLTCHEEAFGRLVRLCLEDFARELERYVDSARVRRSEILRTWTSLEPYRMLLPASCSPLIAQLFVSNCKIALEILKCREQFDDQAGSAAIRAATLH